MVGVDPSEVGGYPTRHCELPLSSAEPQQIGVFRVRAGMVAVARLRNPASGRWGISPGRCFFPMILVRGRVWKREPLIASIVESTYMTVL